MKYYLTCGECGKEPDHISRRGGRVVHRCPDGHQTTETDEKWLEKVIPVWDSFHLAVPYTMKMTRYQIRRWHFRLLDENPSIRLRGIVRLKGYKDGHGPRS